MVLPQQKGRLVHVKVDQAEASVYPQVPGTTGAECCWGAHWLTPGGLGIMWVPSKKNQRAGKKQFTKVKGGSKTDVQIQSFFFAELVQVG